MQVRGARAGAGGGAGPGGGAHGGEGRRDPAAQGGAEGRGVRAGGGTRSGAAAAIIAVPMPLCLAGFGCSRRRLQAGTPERRPPLTSLLLWRRSGCGHAAARPPLRGLCRLRPRRPRWPRHARLRKTASCRQVGRWCPAQAWRRPGPQVAVPSLYSSASTASTAVTCTAVYQVLAWLSCPAAVLSCPVPSDRERSVVPPCHRPPRRHHALHSARELCRRGALPDTCRHSIGAACGRARRRGVSSGVGRVGRAVGRPAAAAAPPLRLHFIGD